jgi:uncharacterized protein (DUF58 family)
VAISGWFVLLVLAGAIPVIATGDGGVLALWILGCAILGLLDLLIAGSPRQLVVSREVPGRVRLGEAAASTLLIANAGRRTVRGVARDGWPPSAGAAPSRHRVSLPAG